MLQVQSLWERYADLTYPINKRRFWELQIAHALSAVDAPRFDGGNRLRQNILIVDDSGWGKSTVVEEAFGIFGVQPKEIIRIGASSTMEGFGHPGVREEQGEDDEGRRVKKLYLSDPPIAVSRYVCIDELLSFLTNSGGHANVRMMTEVCSWIERSRGDVIKQGIKNAEPEAQSRWLHQEAEGQWSFLIPGTFIGLTTEMPDKVAEAARKGGFMNRFTVDMGRDDNEAAIACIDGLIWTQKPELKAEYQKLRQQLVIFNRNLMSAKIPKLETPGGEWLAVVNELSGRRRYVEIANEMGIRTKSVTSLRETADIERYIAGYAILRACEEQKGFEESDLPLIIEYKREDAENVGQHFYGMYAQKLAELETLKVKKTGSNIAISLKHIEALAKVTKPEEKAFATNDFQEAYKTLTKQPMTKAVANKVLNALQSHGVVDRLKSGRKAMNVLLVTPEEAARIATQ